MKFFYLKDFQSFQQAQILFLTTLMSLFFVVLGCKNNNDNATPQNIFSGESETSQNAPKISKETFWEPRESSDKILCNKESAGSPGMPTCDCSIYKKAGTLSCTPAEGRTEASATGSSSDLNCRDKTGASFQFSFSPIDDYRGIDVCHKETQNPPAGMNGSSGVLNPAPTPGKAVPYSPPPQDQPPVEGPIW